jgi:acyl carrier protein
LQRRRPAVRQREIISWYSTDALEFRASGALQNDLGVPVDRRALTDALRSYIAEKILEGDAESLDEKTQLLELGILDSFAIIELLSFIESDFGVQIGLEAVTPEKFSDISVIVDLILQTQDAERAGV